MKYGKWGPLKGYGDEEEVKKEESDLCLYSYVRARGVRGHRREDTKARQRENKSVTTRAVVGRAITTHSNDNY